MSKTRVEIIIDELSLHGFSPAERDAIGASLSLELQRLVTAGDPTVLTNLGSAPLLRANNITLEPGAKSQTVGAQVANAVHGGLTK
jgi:hypothetical protein